MTVRCVHLELVESLETDDFINGLQRFISRRENLVNISSCSGTNYKGASKELREELKKLNQTKIGNFCATKSINWRFNPPSAPHMGGAWERLVRTFKSTMRIILRDTKLTDMQLMTFLAEIENIVNGRPLTKASEDPNDLQPLTPNHFLKGFNNPEIITEQGEYTCRKRWKHVQMCLKHFWSRWRKEYLSTLQTRQKWNIETPNIKENEMVLIQTEAPRGSWPMGIIIQTVPGRDGRVRMAHVKTAAGTYMRPVSKLCKLELP